VLQRKSFFYLDEERGNGEDSPSEPEKDADATTGSPISCTTDMKEESAANSCPICDKQFKGPSANKILRRHLDIHAPEPKFPCPHCDAKFNQNSNRHRHIKTLHRLEMKQVKTPAASKSRGKKAKAKKQRQMVRNYRFSNFIIIIK
jgi:uncharacterized Zn-finger protein